MPAPLDTSSQAREPDPRLARSRARLIDAATELLAEGGVDAVTIDAVIRRAGVARATLYRHFGSGTELLAAAFQQLLPPVASAPEVGSLRSRLVALVCDQARLIDQAPLQLTVLSWMGMSNPEADRRTTEDDASRPHLTALRHRIIEQYRGPFDAILASEAARASLRPAIEATTAVAQFVGPMIFNRLVTGLPNDQQFCTVLVDDFLAANAARKTNEVMDVVDQNEQ
ncbi:TetR family transcriptional regulator [Nocardia sp. 852002-20019_SCH5090214]|jgi:AcrR family transcriptional regulator|uniref:TetR family transcriptional regulator n=2 Tax=Nocardia TaxID=1817 RepID=A0A2S5ZWB6_9NOCA|nr:MULTISPECIES: TetR/AcrR family transcriptional regulator [Nocardia]MDN2495316.1 TetR/AcrR family transcriptional regulator [Nocardia nova]OBA50091.1 TetR family transcriptional regulator [Nocardia sp. 852002-20019_SCH5090214]OXR40626.1 putative HTH-type transcriptional regulator [Nocardia cerradoensis]PPJ10790.1 TetR family transcriptional regulator [Nocardia nova]PPJ17378.1 TetR family transcriptional regulator [Nocardia nova]